MEKLLGVLGVFLSVPLRSAHFIAENAEADAETTERDILVVKLTPPDLGVP